MSFQKQVQKHLEEYKTQRLGVTEKGTYNGKEYGHILPEKLRQLNIFEQYRKEFFEYQAKNDIGLHQYFHHLNSSQALCFNFFYPFIHHQNLEFLASLFELGDAKPVAAAFEKVIDWDEYTNFDFYLEFEDKRVFFEIKYMEIGFGTASPDDEHRKKLKDTYLARLTGKVNPEYLREELFFKNYQILRNISYLDESTDDRLVFIYPADNSGLIEELLKMKQHILAESKIKHRIMAFAWEDILNKAFSMLNKGHGFSEIFVLLQAIHEKYFSYQRKEDVGMNREPINFRDPEQREAYLRKFKRRGAENLRQELKKLYLAGIIDENGRTVR